MLVKTEERHQAGLLWKACILNVSREGVSNVAPSGAGSIESVPLQEGLILRRRLTKVGPACWFIASPMI